MTPKVAEAAQRRLAARVVAEGEAGDARRIAGVDVAYDEARDLAVAAAAVLDPTTLETVELRVVETPLAFPYTPGLFSLTEAPPVLAALAALDAPPDLIVCDGHGLAHPRRFGLACHVGVETGLPTIGCAKSRLAGAHGEPGHSRGSVTALVEGGDEIGAVLRTRDGVRPVFVSVGHRITLAAAVAWVLRLAPRHRLPETTRTADQAVRRALRA